MKLRTPNAAAALACGALLAACGPRHERAPLEPMGRLPGLVTTAEPEWIPFQVAAGARLPSDPREERLTEVRAIAVGGAAQRLAWSPDGRALLVEVKRDGAACEEAWLVPLGRSAPKRVSGAGSRARIGAYVSPDRVVVAESACADGPAATTWQIVEIDLESNARRVVARPAGEVLGVARDEGFAFFGVRAAGKKDRIERVALGGGAPTSIADCATLDASTAVARAQVVFACHDKETAQLVTTSDEGSPAKPWSAGQTVDVDAALSGDGRTLVFASSRAAARGAKKAEGPFQLYLAALSEREVASGDAPERITFAGSSNRAPALGPEGRIAWLSDRGAPGGPLGVIVARFEAP